MRVSPAAVITPPFSCNLTILKVAASTTASTATATANLSIPTRLIVCKTTFLHTSEIYKGHLEKLALLSAVTESLEL